MKRILTAAIVVAALILPSAATALAADGPGRTVLTADGWFFEELPDGTIHSIYVGVTKRPGARFGDLWFTESWGVPVMCDNGTKRTSDDWMGYEWTTRDGSGRVTFKMNRSLRHALAEGDIAFQTTTYSDCAMFVEPGVNGGVDAGSGDGSRVAPDQMPGSGEPGAGPTIHIVLALDGYGRLQRPEVIALVEGSRCLGGPDGTRCGAGPGAYREALGTLVIDDILFAVDGRLGRMRNSLEPVPVGAETTAP
jgi:hypothetical protein